MPLLLNTVRNCDCLCRWWDDGLLLTRRRDPVVALWRPNVELLLHDDARQLLAWCGGRHVPEDAITAAVDAANVSESCCSSSSPLHRLRNACSPHHIDTNPSDATAAQVSAYFFFADFTPSIHQAVPLVHPFCSGYESTQPSTLDGMINWKSIVVA